LECHRFASSGRGTKHPLLSLPFVSLTLAIPFIDTCIAQLEERGLMSCLDALLEESDDELFGPDNLEPSLAESQVCAHIDNSPSTLTLPPHDTLHVSCREPSFIDWRKNQSSSESLGDSGNLFSSI
jgi:hypothetical protein